MKRIALLVVFCCLTSGLAYAQEKTEPAKPPAQDARQGKPADREGETAQQAGANGMNRSGGQPAGKAEAEVPKRRAMDKEAAENKLEEAEIRNRARIVRGPVKSAEISPERKREMEKEAAADKREREEFLNRRKNGNFNAVKPIISPEKQRELDAEAAADKQEREEVRRKHKPQPK